jgi:glycosyltransferase involved in cell wall biosynthesis
MRKKNILMIVENSYPDDPRVRKEANSLKGRFDITVIALGKRGERMRETVDGVRVVRIPRLPHLPVGKFHYLLEYLYLTTASMGIFLLTFPLRRYRIIHANNPPDMLFLVGLLGRLFGARFVFDHHDLSPELYLTRFSGRKDLVYRTLLWLERRSYRLAHVVITTNESYRALAAERHRVAPAKILVVRNDPVLANVNPVGKRVAPPSPPLAKKSILFLGSINPQDGLDLLLEVVRILAVDRGRRDFKCYILGDGDSLAGQSERASRMGIDDFVEFKGFVSDRDAVRGYLSEATVGVEPAPENPLNRHSTFIKIMEYMAAGRPVVAFDLPESRISLGDAGILVPPGDVSGFADAVVSLLDDPKESARLGEAGKRRIADHLNWENAERALNQAYDRVAG